MQELTHLQSSTRGCCDHLTRLLKKTEEILAHQNDMTDLVLTSAKSTRDQLSKKLETLKTLDVQISPKLNEAEDLERDIIEAEDIQEEIVETIAKLSVNIDSGITISPPTAMCSCEFNGISWIYLKFVAPRLHEISEAVYDWNQLTESNKTLHITKIISIPS